MFLYEVIFHIKNSHFSYINEFTRIQDYSLLFFVSGTKVIFPEFGFDFPSVVDLMICYSLLFSWTKMLNF